MRLVVNYSSTRVTNHRIFHSSLISIRKNQNPMLSQPSTRAVHVGKPVKFFFKPCYFVFVKKPLIIVGGFVKIQLEHL